MIVALLAAALSQGPAPPQKILIQDVRIVSPERNVPLQHGYVVIEGDKIAAVGQGKPPGAHWDSVVSGAGRVLTPGLIDGHTHLAVPAGLPLPVPAELGKLAAIYAEQLPRSYLYSGFTTVVDLAVFDRASLDRFKAAPVHPDIYDCGGGLALANGYPMAMASKEVGWRFFPNFLYDPRQKDSIPARFRQEDHTPKATVARVAADSGICVKTYEERGFGPVRNLPTPTLEMIRDVARESHARGLPVLMHANSFSAWRFATEARVDVIAHGMWNWDELDSAGKGLPASIRALLDTVVARRIGFMPTLRVIDGLGAMYDPAFLGDPRLARVLPASVIAWYRTPAGQAFANLMRQNFKDASEQRIREIFHGVADHAALVASYLVSHGGRLVFGSDTPSGLTYGNPPGLNGFLELERLAGAGIPLDRLFEAATIGTARAFHLEKRYGTIEVGKVANLLLLRSNPLETVEAYDKIDLVISRGSVLERSTLAAQSPTGDSTRFERLASLGRLWVAVKYFHPWLAYRPIDWDAALVAAVPRVSGATDRAAYAAAIGDMLAVLGDSVTRVQPDRTAEVPSAGREPDPKSWWTADSVLVVSLRNAGDLADFNRNIERLTSIADTVRLARRVVFDLRASARQEGIDYELGESGLCSLFAPVPARAPDQRGRLYSGFVPETGQTSGGYSSGFQVVDGFTVPPGDSTASRRTAAILVNGNSAIPEAMLALQRAGRAQIVAEGNVSDAGSVQTVEWRVADGLRVSIRLTELMGAGGSMVSLADTTVPPSVGAESSGVVHDAGLAAALAVLAGPARTRTARQDWPASRAMVFGDAEAATADFPALPYRLMAAFRIWAIGQYFFPYRDLMRERWDRVLSEAIRSLEAAHDGVDYGLALAEMAAHLHDSHVRVTSPALEARFGTALPPVYVRMIEGQPVITHFMNDSLARRAGARVGDVILSVDGEDARVSMRRLGRYISASTPQALERIEALRMMRGRTGTTVRLRVRRAGGVERTLELIRTEDWDLTGRHGPVFRVLPGNVGYADLARLRVDQVDSMFEQFKDTRALVFDMRGYPLGTAWAIAPRLSRTDMPVAARFIRPTVTTPDTTARGSLEFLQQLPHTDQWRYRRPTVMLIDERTISQAEHTGLFFEVANGTKFIGSPTTGANGDVTTAVLPGRVTMSFTGQAVRHADGRQLQRVGLKPDVPSRPTIAGIRAGRDEVLERALRYLDSGVVVPGKRALNPQSRSPLVSSPAAPGLPASRAPRPHAR